MVEAVLLPILPPSFWNGDLKKKRKALLLLPMSSKAGQISITDVDPECNLCTDTFTEIVIPHLSST